MRWPTILQVLSSVLLVSCTSTPPPPPPDLPVYRAAKWARQDHSDMTSMETLDDQYVLLLGDTVSFRIVEEFTKPYSLKVRKDGTVMMPYIGEIPAAGLTCRELARQVQRRLVPKHLGKATVLIGVEWASRT